MEINKALELGLQWAEKRMASELTKMDKEYILTGIKASLVKNCSIPVVVGRSEQLKDKAKLTFDEYVERFYINNGFNHESKRTGKLVDINEITERYRWYAKNF